MWITLSDSLCELGESPFWHPQERALYWVDIPGRHRALRTRGDIGKNARVERWRMPSEPGCIAPARRGGLGDRAARRRLSGRAGWGGPLSLIAAADLRPATMRFNDGKCDPLGRFWAGTHERGQGPAERSLYSPGRAPRADRALVQMANEATTANGLAFSPDATRMYWPTRAAHRDSRLGLGRRSQRAVQAARVQGFSAKPKGWDAARPGAMQAGRTAPRWMRRATTGPPCSRAARCCASRPRASRSRRWRCRRSVRPCRASAATT